MAFEKKEVKELRTKLEGEGKTKEEIDAAIADFKAKAGGPATPGDDEDEDENVPEVTSVSKVKMVQIYGQENHEAHIGGVSYYVEEKQKQMVPADVAMILQNAGVAIRL